MTREERFIAAYIEHDGNEHLIYEKSKIHPSVQRNLLRDSEVVQRALAAHSAECARLASSLPPPQSSFKKSPSEPELLEEILAMARRSNVANEYASAVKGYEAYGRRAYGWRNEQRTELTAEITVDLAAARKKVIAALGQVSHDRGDRGDHGEVIDVTAERDTEPDQPRKRLA